MSRNICCSFTAHLKSPWNMFFIVLQCIFKIVCLLLSKSKWTQDHSDSSEHARVFYVSVATFILSQPGLAPFPVTFRFHSRWFSRAKTVFLGGPPWFCLLSDLHGPPWSQRRLSNISWRKISPLSSGVSSFVLRCQNVRGRAELYTYSTFGFI